MALIEVQVPDIGSTDPVAVIELLVKVGDTVAVEQSLITVESDKASMEIPSSHAGVVQALRVQLGDQVKEGSVVLVLESMESNQATAQAQPAVAAIKSEVKNDVKNEVTAAATAPAAPAAPAAAVDVLVHQVAHDGHSRKADPLGCHMVPLLMRPIVVLLTPYSRPSER